MPCKPKQAIIGTAAQSGTPMAVTGDGPPSVPSAVCTLGGGLSAARCAHV
jgi:hypothetical protein